MSQLEFGLLFSTSNQNIFGSGEAFNFIDDRFLGFDFDESVDRSRTIPIPFFDDIDVGFSAFIDGEVGLQSTLDLDGGTVNAFIPIDLFLDVPDEAVREGETFTIHSGFSFGETTGDIKTGPFFTTSSPNASYDLDLIFDVATEIDVDPGPNLGFDVDETVNLISFDSSDSLGVFTSPLIDINASVPSVATLGRESSPGSNQLTSSGSDEFIDGSLDLDFIATSAFLLPPLQEDITILDFTISAPLPFVPDIDIEASFDYNLLDIEAAIALSLIQQFSLSNITLPALLMIEGGTTLSFNIGEEIRITVPNDIGEFLEVDAVIDFDALFSNNTDLGLNFALDFLVGEFGLNLPIIPDFSVGPLFEDSLDLFETSFGVFDSTFDLEGFNQETISFQVEIVPPTSGTSGRDLITGTPENDSIDGLGGNDTLAGFLGDDTLRGGDGDDVLRGDLNSGNSGGTVGGNDVIFGGEGNDRIGGKAGNDSLFGGVGNDAIWGDDGDDLLRGGLGNDTLTGDDFSDGAGSDTFVLAAGEGTDTIEDFEIGVDFIGLADGLTFSDLNFRGNTINAGDETLAILESVNTTVIAEESFVMV